MKSIDVFTDASNAADMLEIDFVTSASVFNKVASLLFICFSVFSNCPKDVLKFIIFLFMLTLVL